VKSVLLAIVATLAATGCTTDLELFIDLRTDLVPDREFERVRVIVEPGGVREIDTAGTSSESWIGGARVAELPGLEAGEHLLVVTLFDDGGVVLDRTVRVDLRETTALTVLATRDCTDVPCDAETTCRAATCVDERCSELSPEFCGDPECSSDAECASASACSTGRCVLGSCLYEADDAACASGQWCNPDTGCQNLPGTPGSLPGEDVTVASEWTVELWSDFSDRYTYIPDQYDDDGVALFSNRPHHLFLIEEPFDPGLGLLATWEIWELREPDVIVEHDSYFRAVSSSAGPDAFFDAEFCGAYMAPAAGICVGVGSQNSGDGIFRIELDWSITQVSSVNNVGDLAFDETGAFDGSGVPTLFWAGPDGLRRFGESVFYSGMLNGAFTEILPNGDIFTMHTDRSTGERRLVRVEPITYAETTFLSTFDGGPDINVQNAGVYRVVGGDISDLPAYAYAIIGQGTLVSFDAAGAMSVVAETDPMGDWIWAHAVVAPASHTLAQGGPTFYVYEFDPTTETNRVFRLTPN